ncbi:unnamed protein product [Rhodiola kirilowii]
MTLMEKGGVPSVVAKVSRLDWFRNAAGLVDANYWKGSLSPRPVLDWYLKRVDDAVREAKELAEGGEVNSSIAKTLVLGGILCRQMVVSNVFMLQLFGVRFASALSIFIAVVIPLKEENVFVTTVDEQYSEGGTLSVIGHSAGGWLARVYMEEFGRDGISLLLTLGTPHLPPPKGLPGVIDQTRGLLYYVEEQCAKPEYTPEVKYVCIAGRYIQGSPIFGPSDVASDYTTSSLNTIQPDSEAATLNDITKSAPPTLRARFVGQGYKQVCGQSDVWGDGVVPEVSAHLDGALNISLDGVYHSPVGSDDELRPWYGSPAIVDQWIHHLLH